VTSGHVFIIRNTKIINHNNGFLPWYLPLIIGWCMGCETRINADCVYCSEKCQSIDSNQNNSQHLPTSTQIDETNITKPSILTNTSQTYISKQENIHKPFNITSSIPIPPQYSNTNMTHSQSFQYSYPLKMSESQVISNFPIPRFLRRNYSRKRSGGSL
jgi:hypothetical protein